MRSDTKMELIQEKKAPEIKNVTIPFYDFFTERKWLMFLGGLSTLGKTEFWLTMNWIYFGWVIAFLLFALALQTAAAFAVMEDTLARMLAAHFVLITILMIAILFTRAVYNDSHISAAQYIREGIYRYDYEDSTVYNIRKNGVDYINKMTTYLRDILAAGLFSNFIGMPVTKILLSDGPKIINNVNLDFPMPMYCPFDTENFLGYTIAWIIVLLFTWYLLSAVIGLNEIYVSCAVQLRIQLEILNYSLKTIEKRAFMKLVTMGKASLQYNRANVKELYKKTEFQEAIYVCLKENIKHHQTSVSFRDLIHPFFGAYLLALFTLASATLAMAVILILESDELVNLTDFALNCVIEMGIVFSLCLYGEHIIGESSKICDSLFTTPWVNCEKRFSVIMSIMMTNTIKPMTLTSRLYPIAASVESFGNIVSTMYQIINVVRNT